MKQLLERLSAHWRVWVGLISGPFSVILLLRAALLTTNADALWYWIGAYICGAISAAMFIWRQHIEIKKLQEISRLQDAAPIRLSAHQLWEMFRTDPVGSQTRLRMVQVQGLVLTVRQGVDEGRCQVELSAQPPQEPRFESAEGAWRTVTLAAMRTPKIVVCYFDSQVTLSGNAVIEGQIGAYEPLADGGRITLLKCRLVE